MKKMRVNPGVCGLESIITVESDDGMEAAISVETQCPAVRKMLEALEQPLSAYEICFLKPGQGPVYAAAENLAHAACPVPAAVIKAVEAECGLALAKNAAIEFIG